MPTIARRLSRAVSFTAVFAAPLLAWAAPQPHNATPVAAVALPRIAFEIDYAVSGTTQSSAGLVQSDTIVSIGLAGSPATKCNVQVEWFDWDGTFAGFSGDNSFKVSLLNPGETLEFTSSAANGAPLAYPPFEQNVFRSQRTAFEGHAAILTDCPATVKLRADAEFATLTTPASGGLGTAAFKPINITKVTGLTGY